VTAPLHPAQFGTKVRRALNHPDVYKLIDSHPDTAGSTPQCGACRAVAVGLHSVLPGSTVHGIESADGIEHFAVHHEGRYVDSRGTVSPQGMRRRWKQETGKPVKIRPVSDAEIYSHESPDPHDQKTGMAMSDRIAEHLKRHL
jgi:hypothetical protein